jgi:hypothetical protein
MVVAVQRVFREHPVQWLTAAPLWQRLEPSEERIAEQRIAFRQPAILRFTTDTFMEDFLTVVTTAPHRLREWQVQRETWRKPAPLPPVALPRGQSQASLTPVRTDTELGGQPLKLYQPVHQRFYLVTANLVCRVPGLPDRDLRRNKEEHVSFVLRRRMLNEAEEISEYALVAGTWQAIATGQEQQLVSAEQRFPMFPVTYPDPVSGHRRRLFSGLIPVSGREAFMTAGRQSSSEPLGSAETTSDLIDSLLTVFEMDVLAPWRMINRQVTIGDEKGIAKRLIDSSLTEIKKETDNAKRRQALNDLKSTVQVIRNQLQESSWYVLLDFADFLNLHLNALWLAIQNPSLKSDLPRRQRGLYDALETAQFEPGDDTFAPDETESPYYELIQGRTTTSSSSTRLTTALLAVSQKRTQLEQATVSYPNGSASNWPSKKCLLCGRNLIDLVGNLETLDNPLRTLITNALAEAPPSPTQRIPLVPSAKQISETTHESDYANDTFVIRCVFERPHCPPSLFPAVVSAATEPFQMASYFDPDAPARAIRIPMPIDTTPGGLRKYARNTMFIISDTLACQLQKAQALTFGDLVRSALPWPFHQDLPEPSSGRCKDEGVMDFGKICTFSIPIITLCALVLMIIIVFLLDIIFKWVPYLFFCFPLPGLKAKRGESS